MFHTSGVPPPHGSGGGPPLRRRPRHPGGEYDVEEYAPRSKLPGQRPIDFFSSSIRHVFTRLEHRRTPFGYHLIPNEYYAKDVLPVRETNFNPSTAFCTQWASTSMHPDSRQLHKRFSLYGLQWAPHGNRLLCSTSQGEFLLFNGKSFGVEVKTAAHENACRAVAWGRRTDLIASGSDAGKMKLWMSNMVVAAEVDSNHRAVRDLSWAPLEAKLVSCGQDGSSRVWDVARLGSNAATPSGSPNATTGGGASSTGAEGSTSVSQDASAYGEELRLEGHGGEVTTVEWHPLLTLIASGSQDTHCRLWDPRTGAAGSLAVLQGHRQTLTAVRWHPTRSHWLLTAAKDSVVRLWDIRQPQTELMRFSGHSAAVEAARWHPFCSDLFATTGEDGSILYWLVKESESEAVVEAAKIEAAHGSFRDRPNPVNSLAWSPQGHMLASSGYEVKYWARNKPGAHEERERDTEVDVLEENE